MNFFRIFAPWHNKLGHRQNMLRKSLTILFITSSLAASAQTGFWTDENNYDTSWYGEEKLGHHDYETGEYVWNDPNITYFTISTPAQLAGLAKLINDGQINSFSYWPHTPSFRLSGDIDLAGHYWYPIGIVTKRFFGNFDGNGHKIKNMVLDFEGLEATFPGTMYFGLFGYVGTSTISNLTIDPSCKINGTRKNGGVSALIGGSGSDCTIENCVNYADIKTNGGAGGIIGEGNVDMYSSAIISISGCTNYGNISSFSGEGMENSTFGGIVGSTSSSNITNCENHGDISGVSNLGGIGGSVSGTLTDCRNYGNIKSTISTGTMIGGISGYAMTYLNVSECSNYGNISGASFIGGIIGYSSARGPSKFISGSANHGSVTACEYKDDKGVINTSHAAGIIARFNAYDPGNDESCQIFGCLNDGNVSVVNGDAAGIALNSEYSMTQNINSCLNKGTITANYAYGIGNIFLTINCGNEGTIRGVGTYYDYQNYRCSPKAYGISAGNEVYNSYNHGTLHISGKGYDALVAGIGYRYVNNCYNTGEFDIDISELRASNSWTPVARIGALSSYFDDDDKIITNCYYSNYGISGRPGISGGIYISENDMKTQGFLEKLNANKSDYVNQYVSLGANTWSFDAIAGYPIPFIESPGISFIDKITSASKTPQETGRYDIRGNRLSRPTKGINIITYSDGTSKKVFVY